MRVVIIVALIMEPLNDIVVIYHAHCPDGIASAWGAWKKIGDSASYIACSDREVPPEGLENKEIYIVDFSYPAEVLKKLHETNKKVVILDHHISAKEAVLSIPGGVFDIERSGAGMTWDYFFPGVPRPKLIDYIEKGDVNPHNLPEGEHLSQRIAAAPFTLEAYDDLIARYEKNPESLVDEGKVIELYTNQIFNIVREDYEMVLFEGHTIPSINIALPQTTKSQALKLLYTMMPPLAMSYRYDNGLWKVSLRSNGDVDCSVLAGKYGGGGHRGSAGFVVPADIPLPFVKLANK
jgi:hypothetical protein